MFQEELDWRFAHCGRGRPRQELHGLYYTVSLRKGSTRQVGHHLHLPVTRRGATSCERVTWSSIGNYIFRNHATPRQKLYFTANGFSNTPKGYTWVGNRLTTKQAATTPENIWQEHLVNIVKVFAAKSDQGFGR